MGIIGRPFYKVSPQSAADRVSIQREGTACRLVDAVVEGISDAERVEGVDGAGGWTQSCRVANKWLDDALVACRLPQLLPMRST